jgi:hypothetical protein
LQCRPYAIGRRRNGGYLSTWSEERSSPPGIPEGGRHPGFRKRVTLRGVTPERGPRSAHEDGGNIQPTVRSADDTQGCSRSALRRGTFVLVVLRQQAAKGKVLRSTATRPAQSSAVIRRPSQQTVVGSKRRPQAALRSEGGFRGFALRRACSAVERAPRGLSRLAAIVFLLREGKVVVP